MSLDRFRTLADAYGGAIARWPQADRDAAERLSRDPDARALLNRASALDAVLDAWHVPAPSLALAGRIAKAAPASRERGRARLWWSGLGVTAALAGAAGGSLATAALAPVALSWESATAFGDLGGEDAP